MISRIRMEFVQQQKDRIAKPEAFTNAECSANNQTELLSDSVMQVYQDQVLQVLYVIYKIYNQYLWEIFMRTNNTKYF
jgi:hypothetical protein